MQLEAVVWLERDCRGQRRVSLGGAVGSTTVVRDATVFPGKVTPASLLANAVNLTYGNHVYLNNGLPTLIYVP